jgi:hypothetical protein
MAFLRWPFNTSIISVLIWLRNPRAEDGFLVLAVAKYSTSDVLGRDWSEVASDLSGRSNSSGKSVTGFLILWRN